MTTKHSPATNAYLQLVEALKSIAALDEQEDDETHERAIEQIVAMGNIARALLRSLGEDA